MSVLNITVGGDVMGEARRAFIDTWHRAGRGEHFCERHRAFDNWSTLMQVLTVKRAELISYVQRHEVTSIQQLATGIGRNESDVSADVELLESKGFLDASGGRIRTHYDAIEARITF